MLGYLIIHTHIIFICSIHLGMCQLVSLCILFMFLCILNEFVDPMTILEMDNKISQKYLSNFEQLSLIPSQLRLDIILSYLSCEQNTVGKLGQCLKTSAKIKIPLFIWQICSKHESPLESVYLAVGYMRYTGHWVKACLDEGWLCMHYSPHSVFTV